MMIGTGGVERGGKNTRAVNDGVVGVDEFVSGRMGGTGVCVCEYVRVSETE